MVVGPDITSRADLEAVRRGRRHPRLTQPDYLHLRGVVRGLEEALAAVERPVADVLDVWCGSRPYDDLLPAGSRCTGLDVGGNPYGVADVVSDELLPFESGAFDLVLCVQAFQYMAEPERVVAEFDRVLRPGGAVVVSLVFGYEYARASAFEGRYTEHQLRAAFAGWDEVRIQENGGRATTWGVLTGSLLFGVEQRLPRLARLLLRPAFAASYALVNVTAATLGRLEHDGTHGAALPTNLTLRARKA